MMGTRYRQGRGRWAWVLVGCWMAWSSEGWAQAPASEIFEPQAVGSTAIWSVASAGVSPHLSPSLELVGHWADAPVELRRRADDSAVSRLVANQVKLDVGLGVGLFDRVEVGMVLPVVLHQEGDGVEGLPAANPIDLGEARAQLRLKLWQWGGFGLGAQVTGYVPTSAEAPYQSSGSPGALGALIADYRGQGGVAWRVAANVGWAVREATRGARLETDDRLDARLGAKVDVMPGMLAVQATAYGRWEALAEVPVALSAGYLGGVQVRWGGSGLTSTLGAGGALAGGYGAPDARVVASLSYAPGGAAGAMRAGSGRGAGRAGCVGPEDVDGFEDADGCADPDNDGDGVADVDDGCANEPEDRDGFEDADGCPDPDNDGDGVRDFDDACPLEPGVARTSGCPFTDDDGDGIDASVDRCPDEAEDVDGFEDSDGCADVDNDADGVVDVDDGCPLEPETINGVADADGCPDEGASAVRLTGDRIEILERVHFDTGRATIQRRSHSVLEQVAGVLEARPEISLLRVQGHTDDRGAEDDNLALSQQRAAAVKAFLIERGVAARRLSARGYGESHPIADNATAQGRADNRRVEFHIIERAAVERGER